MIFSWKNESFPVICLLANVDLFIACEFSDWLTQSLHDRIFYTVRFERVTCNRKMSRRLSRRKSCDLKNSDWLMFEDYAIKQNAFFFWTPSMPIACSSALTPILREFSILQLDVNPDVLQKCVCWKSHLQPDEEFNRRSYVSIDRFSTECTSTRHKTGSYNGISIFVKFIELDSVTLSRDDLLELKLVRPLDIYRQIIFCVLF